MTCILQVLSLQLLKILLENSGAVFRNSERFQGAIKQHLCLSLLKNVTVPSAQVKTPPAACLQCMKLQQQPCDHPVHAGNDPTGMWGMLWGQIHTH